MPRSILAQVLRLNEKYVAALTCAAVREPSRKKSMSIWVSDDKSSEILLEKRSISIDDSDDSYDYIFIIFAMTKETNIFEVWFSVKAFARWNFVSVSRAKPW